MTNIEQAQAILGQRPLPADAEAQIDALYEAADADERAMFAQIYEGLSVAMMAADEITIGPDTGGRV